MYGRLVLVLAAAWIGLSLAAAYGFAGGGTGAGRLTAGFPGELLPAYQALTQPGQTLFLFLRNLVTLGIGLLLARAAAFHPGHHPRGWAVILKLAAVGAGFGFLVSTVYHKSLAAGATAAVLAPQAGTTPGAALAAGYLPHGLAEILALALFLAVPPYWAARSIATGSLARATFEAWMEARRLLVTGISLLGAAAVIEVYFTPLAIGWLMR